MQIISATLSSSYAVLQACGRCCFGRETDNCPKGFFLLGLPVRYLRSGKRMPIREGKGMPESCQVDEYGQYVKVDMTHLKKCDFDFMPLGQASIPRTVCNLTQQHVPLYLPKGSYWVPYEGDIVDDVCWGHNRTQALQSKHDAGFAVAGYVSPFSQITQEHSQWHAASSSSLGSGEVVFSKRKVCRTGMLMMEKPDEKHATPYIKGVVCGVKETCSYSALAGEQRHTQTEKLEESAGGKKDPTHGAECSAAANVKDASKDLCGPTAVVSSGAGHSTMLCNQSAAQVDEVLEARVKAKMLKPCTWEVLYVIVGGAPELGDDLLVAESPPSPSSLMSAVATPRSTFRNIKRVTDTKKVTVSDTTSQDSSDTQ